MSPPKSETCLQIWFNSDLPTRIIVKVTNDGTRRSVYCASRKIDDNFLEKYNKPPRRHIAREDLDALVMSEWYRDALGGFATTARSDGKRIRLPIAQSRVPLWGSIRAVCHHPDIVARIGTRLGVLGAWVGLVGITASVLDYTFGSSCEFVGKRCEAGPEYLKLGILVIVVSAGAIVGWLACLGVKRPSRGAKLRSSS